MIVLLCLQAILVPLALCSLAWLERIPRQSWVPLLLSRELARYNKIAVAWILSHFVVSFVGCSVTLLLIPAMLAGIWSQNERGYLWTLSCSLLLICLVVGNLTTVIIKNIHVAALLLSLLTLAVAVWLSSFAALSCKSSEDGSDCTYLADSPPQNSSMGNQSVLNFGLWHAVRSIGALGALLGGFLSGCGAILTPSSWVAYFQPNGRIVSAGANGAILATAALLSVELGAKLTQLQSASSGPVTTHSPVIPSCSSAGTTSAVAGAAAMTRLTDDVKTTLRSRQRSGPSAKMHGMASRASPRAQTVPSNCELRKHVQIAADVAELELLRPEYEN